MVKLKNCIDSCTGAASVLPICNINSVLAALLIVRKYETRLHIVSLTFALQVRKGKYKSPVNNVGFAGAL